MIEVFGNYYRINRLRSDWRVGCRLIRPLVVLVWFAEGEWQVALNDVEVFQSVKQFSQAKMAAILMKAEAERIFHEPVEIEYDFTESVVR